MRQLLPLLLLTAATPALAVDPDAITAASEEPQVQVERPAKAERLERSERPSMFDRVRRSERPAPEAAIVRPQIDVIEVPEAPERSSAPPLEQVQERRERPTSDARRERFGDSVREWRMRERNAERLRRQEEMPPAAGVPSTGERLVRPERVVPPVTGAPETRRGDRGMGHVLRNRIATEGWRREWREDRRFDWRRHRHWHRDRFRLGFYYDPFGWDYRRWHVGWNLHPRFLSSRFWIDDPWHFRLPPAYGRYRWVRYWNDALLVDLRTGRVVDVVYNVFW